MKRFDPWPTGADVHVEWGTIGARLAAERGHAVVVVDLLSFSTAVTVVAERGGFTLPYLAEELSSGGGGAAVAAAHGAVVLAEARTMTGYSLSPTSLLRVASGERLVATSYNGAGCAVAAFEAGAPVVLAACLRNRRAVAAALADVDRPVTLVCCGERWRSVVDGPDGHRPSVEDWVGAGAVVDALEAATPSPEAAAAASSWRRIDAPLADWLRATVSGRELVAKGFAPDVDVAADVDACAVVPVLDGTRTFVPLRRDT